MIEGNKRANYQNELDRIQNELYRPQSVKTIKRTFRKLLSKVKRLDERNL